MTCRLVRLEQATGEPLVVNPEYVVAVWASIDKVEICVAGMAPFPLAGDLEEIVALIDQAQADG